MKHTPSELHAVFNGLYWDVAVGPHDYSQRVASCHANHVLGHGLEDAERHARLFAAAPGLFGHAKSLVEAWDARTTGAQQIITGKSDRELQKQAMEAIDGLRAAIARARGEQSQSEKEVGNG